MSNPRIPLNKRCHICGYRYESTLIECPFDGVNLGKPRVGLDYLGPYRLIERLAVGGMGAVYRAVYEKAGRAVAIKLLHHSLRNEVVSVSRFFHEARAVNTIRHPNVVEVYDLSAEGEDVFMVLELLRGKDLRTLLGEQPGGCLPPARVAAILEQVCGALQATHARKIVHRDLKPENIFLTTRNGISDFVKLLDFGVAKLERPEGRLTRDGIALGTPEYMAPEQARGAHVDGRTDVYAVGCIAFEMLTGRTVFQGTTPGDVMIKQVREVPPSPRLINPMIPERLESVVLRCLAKSPKGRPASALDLAQEISTAVGTRFDSSGAFVSWQGWDGPSSTSQIEMPAVEVSSRVPRWVPKVVKSAGIRRVAMVTAVALAGIIGIAWFGRQPQHKPIEAVAPVGPIATVIVPQPPPSLTEILIESTPRDAEIFDESGARLGITPQRLALAAGASLKVKLRRAGYRSAEQVIRADADQPTVAVVLEPERRGKRVRAKRAPQLRDR